MSIIVDCHGMSHVGRVRSSNEDQFLIADLNKSMRIHQTSLGLSRQTRLFSGSQGKLMLVADGLGGQESGQRASTLAVDGVANYLLDTMDWLLRVNDENEDEFKSALKAAFRHSQDVVEAEANAIPQRRGMATTLTMAYLEWPVSYVVHVGDTRCYHISNGQIAQLTTDHTLAQLVAEAAVIRGEVSDESKPPQDEKAKNVLWNVIGGRDHSLDPQISKSRLKVGDSLLLCTDGLTAHLADEELLAMALEDRSSQEICESYIELANSRGGKDNITAVLAKFKESDEDSHECGELESTPDLDDTVELNPQVGKSPVPVEAKLP